MTNERIAEIKALCEAARPGPWIRDAYTGEVKINIGNSDFYSIAKEIYYEPDIKFIAAARQIIPELLEALELKAGELTKAREASLKYLGIKWSSGDYKRRKEIEEYRKELELEAAEIFCKPCPFCGGEAKEQDCEIGYRIICHDCLTTSALSQSGKQARDAWNRRTAKPFD